MPKIKGWKKISENNRGARWESRNSDKYIYLTPVNSEGNTVSTIRKRRRQNQDFKRNKIDHWEAGIGNKSKVIKTRSFETKEDAKSWAIRYMNNNPNM